MFISFYFLGSGVATPSSHNTSSVNNYTNVMLSYSDGRKFNEFFVQVALVQKILLILISILIILGNSLVLVATWKERSLHQPNKYFIACLAVADLLVGLFIGPWKFYQWSLDIQSRYVISSHICSFMVWIDILAFTASVCSLMFISYDRYLKISKPLQYRSRMTTSKSLKIIFIIWLISTAFAAYSVSPHSENNGILGSGFPCRSVDISKHKELYTFLTVNVFFLPAMIMLVMYALIFVVAHKRQKMFRNGELGETSTGQNQRSVFRQNLKIVRMLFAVVGVFFLCWVPHGIWNLLIFHYPNFYYLNSSSLSYWYRYFIFDSLIRLLALSNSVCNPMIYACLDQTYREAFKDLFQKMMCRTRSNTQQRH